jgi:RND family efflux transporter MFP subunit
MNMASLTMSGFTSFFSAAKAWVVAHKVWSGLVLLAVLGGGWWLYASLGSANTETRYILGTVERGTIISSISATGQVSASNQVDLVSKVSGDVTSVPVKSGQKVAEGALIAQIDPGDAAYDLETERISYQKLVTVDSTDLAKAEKTATDAYTSARITLAKTTSDLSDTLTELKSLFARNGYLSSLNYTRTKQEKEYQVKAEDATYAAEDAITDFEKTVRTVTINTEYSKIQSALTEGHQTALLLTQAVKSAKDAITYMRGEEGEDGEADDAYTLIGTILTDVTATVDSIATTRSDVQDAHDALQELVDGPDELDLRSAEVAVRQKENTLADYSIRAPFAGTLAAVEVKKGDTLNNNAAIATLITDQKIAEISLNEVDAAKVSVGDKVTLTFDALEDLTLTGEVVEVDLLGAVSQGVVSYTVKIGFDTQDERVKPGMTVNAAIQIDMRVDVLSVPASAVKTQNGSSYVQVFDPPLENGGGNQGVVSDRTPQSVPVEVGLSDDTRIEILSGLAEGQQIVTATRSSTAATSQSGSASGGNNLRAPGMF